MADPINLGNSSPGSFNQPTQVVENPLTPAKVTQANAAGSPAPTVAGSASMSQPAQVGGGTAQAASMLGGGTQVAPQTLGNSSSECCGTGGGGGGSGGYNLIQNNAGAALQVQTTLRFDSGLNAQDQGTYTEAFIDLGHTNAWTVGQQMPSLDRANAGVLAIAPANATSVTITPATIWGGTKKLAALGGGTGTGFEYDSTGNGLSILSAVTANVGQFAGTTEWNLSNAVVSHYKAGNGQNIVVGYSLRNDTAAAAGADQQYSSVFEFVGNGYASVPAVSQPIAFGLIVEPIQGTATTQGRFSIMVNVNNAGYNGSRLLDLDQAGDLTITGGLTCNGIQLNDGHVITGTYNAITIGPTFQLSLQNTTLSTNGNQHFSPGVEFSGTGFGTTAGTSQIVKYMLQVRSVQSTTAQGDFVFWQSLNGASYSEMISLTRSSSIGTGTAVWKPATGIEVGFMSSGNACGIVTVQGNGAMSLYAAGSESLRFYSNELFPITTYAMALGETGHAFSESWVRHNQSISGAAPTFTAGTGAGTGPTIVITGTDIAGLLAVTTGTGPAGANAAIVTVTFNTVWSTAPRAVLLFPANAATAAIIGGATEIYADSITTGHFIVESGSSALVATTAYAWYYFVMG